MQRRPGTTSGIDELRTRQRDEGIGFRYSSPVPDVPKRPTLPAYWVTLGHPIRRSDPKPMERLAQTIR